MPYKYLAFLLTSLTIAGHSFSQHQHKSAQAGHLPEVKNVEAQPLLAQVKRLTEALNFLGSALLADDARRLNELQDAEPGNDVVAEIQAILDPYCLAMIDINPEARVKVTRGPAKAELMQNGWKSFLVKVQNDAGVTAQLEAESRNAEPVLHVSTGDPKMRKGNEITKGQLANRFLEMSFYHNRPLQPQLSGLKLEYAVLQIFSKQAGKREAELTFNIGHGTQDIGFRNAIPVLFNVSKAVKVVFRVNDDDGSPAMASFVIKDGIERILVEDSLYPLYDKLYRTARAQRENGKPIKGLTGLYPLPSRRVAAYDDFPDFFFQAQVYRSDGEYVMLPPGKYDVTFTRGPEYISQTKQIIVPGNKNSLELKFDLKRWIHMAKLGWYSADHHVHAAGCSHYESPEEGVPPMHMWRQIVGEDLNVGAVLAWGPSWYHQKEYFTGKVSPLSTKKNLMRYDIEVSGFPSSHAGHIVLLRLKEDDYPGTTTIEEWPSWTLPVFKWAKSQGAVTGYAHSGWGLEPLQPTTELPNYVTPKMDGIGANEYVVTVTQNVVDFFSAGDTPAPWELNMWYHSLNCGFRTRISGETDFPCIFDERVGIARSYFKSDSVLNFDNYTDVIRTQKSYVSDGGSHIIDVAAGTINEKSELLMDRPGIINVSAKVVANLSQVQDEHGKDIQQRSLVDQPYWSVERARIGSSRQVPVEFIVNGEPVEKVIIDADGSWKDVKFSYEMKQSGWFALRVYPSSHTNPVFIIIDGKPIREKASAEWCIRAIDQCWKMKKENIRVPERAGAEAAYKEAKAVYAKIAEEAPK
ncbi:MAG: CehA/McbA family metallohydrolase [Chitinophagaceae bacterium]|nr:CehA/McbA family metallohydrolase [Chitinophagaceae bacterium]